MQFSKKSYKYSYIYKQFLNTQQFQQIRNEISKEISK